MILAISCSSRCACALRVGVVRLLSCVALVGASTGLLMQGSNIGGLIGPPITGAFVALHGWSSAIWLTTAAMAVVAGAGLFLHWREKRKIDL